MLTDCRRSERELKRMDQQRTMEEDQLSGSPIPPIPSISITRPARRTSISSQLRFTRAFSNDSLDSLEKFCRKELKIRCLMEEDPEPVAAAAASAVSSHPRPSLCPSLGSLGRSVTDTQPSPTLPLFGRAGRCHLKHSTGDLSVDLPSPTRRSVAETIGLSPYQQKLLLQCWPNVYSTGPNGAFANAIYNKLVARSAKAKQLFNKANGVAVFASNNDIDCMTMHARCTVELIDTTIRSLDAEHSKITAALQEIGRYHRNLRGAGLTVAVWDELGDALIESIHRYDAVRKHKELRRAWLAVFAYLIDNFKQGQQVPRSSSSYELTDRSNEPK